MTFNFVSQQTRKTWFSQKNKEKMVVNKNIDINIDSYPISVAKSIVPNIVDINISVTPVIQS